MESSFRILRVRGIEIGANWSYLLIFGLITMSLATSFFPSAYEGLGSSTYWAMGIATSFLFVVCLLLHELGHAFRALKEGMEIEGITLWLLGGVAKFKGMFPSAGAEFRIAIAGPLVTLALIVAFWILRMGATTLAVPEPVTGVIDYLFQINLTLLVFNMLPALPLDGGRVLRSTLWATKRSFLEATVAAARVARAFAWTIIAVGVLFLLTGGYNGLLIALVGYFILQAGQAEVAYAMFRQTLRGRTIRDVMTRDPRTVDPSESVQSFLDDITRIGAHSSYPVTDPWGTLQGLFSYRNAAQVPADQRTTTLVRDVMVPREGLAVVGPDDDIGLSVAAMQEGTGRAVVVDDGGRVIGIVSMSDIARAIELGQTPPAAPPRSGRLLTAVLIAGGIGAIGYFVTPPFVTFAPGTAFDVTKDIEVEGIRADRVRGEYLLTSVAVQQPNLFGLGWALASGKDVSPLSAVVPPDVDPEEYFELQEAVFKEAQETAAAAAAKAAGMDVTLTGEGARVESVVEGSPAEERLRPEDVITGIDGAPVDLADDLSRVIRARPAGTAFDLDVRRDDRDITVSVESRAGVIRGAPGIGVNVTTENFEVDLPFEVTFREREIGGPSAGLAYALAVYDLIESSDLAAGRSVATTGTIDFDGNVGPVGGVEQKTEAARRQGAEVFLVPEEEVSLVPRLEALEVVGVATLTDAIEALRG